MTWETPIAGALREIIDELKAFLQTRAEILRVESAQKLKFWKHALAMMAVAVAFLFTAWFAFALSLVALFHALITRGGYSWFWGALIAAGLLATAGLTAGLAGYKSMKSSRLVPERTLNVLQRDKIWLRQRLRSI